MLIRTTTAPAMTSPTRTPTRTEPETVPAPEPVRRYYPGKVCPTQREEVTRRIRRV